MPSRRTQSPDLLGARELVSSLRDEGRNLKERYRGDPLALAERFGVKLPRKPVQIMQDLGVYDPEKHGPIEPGLREMVLDVCLLEVKSAVACANRGGGKSYGVSFIEFYLWMILSFDCLNLGGSELQADAVYQYMLGYLDNDPFWMTLVRGQPARERTYANDDAWVRVLAASQKSVRSPHAGGLRKGKIRGGILVIDEEAEADEGIVDASLSTINTAMPSVNVRCSTFHNIGGSFQQVMDHHVEMGYKLYRWDIFDVCAGCDCSGPNCESEEICFREDHYEDHINPDTGEMEQRLVHKAYCGGRAMYAEGWIPMEEIITLWKRMKRNHMRWEIEAMGQRPGSKDFVIRDMMRFLSSITPDSGASLYLPGCPVTVCVDWGTNAAGVSVWQEQPNDRHVMLEAVKLMDNNQTEVFSKILEFAQKYKRDFLEVAADAGGGGNYLNPQLRSEHRLPVRDVFFNEEKESAVAAWNMLNEAERLTIPEEHEEFIDEVRDWKRKNERIVKGNDHICDSSICYFAKFIDRLGTRTVRVVPRAFSASLAKKKRDESGRDEIPGKGVSTGRRRVPVAMSIGGRKGRRPR